MSVKPVRLFIDPILHKPCEMIADFTGLDNLAGDMVETMLAYGGVGLAAPQIGIDKNLAVLYLENKTKIIVVANLKLICYTKETDTQLEGCLSCPGVSISMKRYLGIEIEAQNLLGEKVKYRFTDYDARIAQHEIAHLNGVMIIDNLLKL